MYFLPFRPLHPNKMAGYLHLELRGSGFLCHRRGLKLACQDFGAFGFLLVATVLAYAASFLFNLPAALWNHVLDAAIFLSISLISYNLLGKRERGSLNSYRITI